MDHVRIDEGIKRGKRSTRNSNKLDSKGRFLPVLPASQHLEAVANAAARIATGEFLEDIARDIGVTKQALSLWLLDECPAEYSTAKRRGLIRRIVDADQLLESADNPLDVAKAREQARFARWDAERRLPALFGPKQEVTVDVRVRVDDSVLEEGKSLISQYIDGQSMLIPEPAEGVPSLPEPSLPPG